MSYKKIFGLEKNIFILGLTSFFNDFSNEMILSAFPAFFTSVLKSGAASLGLVEGIADGASNIIKIYSGNLSDKIRRRRAFIYLGYGLSVLVRPLYMFTGTITGVLGIRFIDRIGKGVREAPRDVLISVSSDKKEEGLSFGYHRAMAALGGIFGPLCAYLILSKWPEGFNYIFILAFALGVIAVCTIFFVKEIGEGSYGNFWSGIRVITSRSIKSFWRFSVTFKLYLISLFIFSAGSMPVAVLLLKSSDIGMTIASIPLLYMVYSVSFSFFSFFAGKLCDSLGSTRVMVFGYLVLILSYILMSWSSEYISLAISFFSLGVFSACTESPQRVIVAQTTPEYERGTAYGLMNGILGFGAVVAGVLGGYLWQMYGSEIALVVSGGLIFFALIIFMTSVRIRNVARVA